jgi:chromosome segregation ATPase
MPQLTALLQAANTQPANQGMRGSTLNTQYESRTGEALGIVGQVQELAATFAEDKQSSIDQENELNEAFNTLMKEKQEQLAILIQQRDQQQAVLNQVNQEIGENENAEATAKSTLQDEQTFLSMIQGMERDTTQLYQMRQKDRAEEKEAVTKAITVLSQEAPSLMQISSTVRRVSLKAPCVGCNKAALLLKNSAQRLHSELLATAAMTTGSGEALIPVIGQLTDLVRRLDEQQHAEEEHKAWCENELAETNKQKTHHEMLVAQLKQSIEETEAVIAEKKQAITDTLDAIKTADEEFKEMEAVRAKEKQDYEAEHADYVDAINALNQAIDILGDFYRESFIQQPINFVQVKQVPVPGASVKADVPEMQTLSGNYVRKGGGHVVNILKTTRQDFQAGMHHLEQEEEQAVKDFQDSKAAYEKSRADLVDAGNRLNAELQTASMALAQYQSDLASNEDKVMSLTSYLAQVGGSCNMLIENFADRTRMRNDEKEAITQAINVLQSVP